MTAKINANERIFLSYARTDLDIAREFRQRLSDALGEAQVWQDLTHLGSDRWWAEIEYAIRATSAIEHLVLLASAQALSREVVQREIRVARREGKTVSLVFWSNVSTFEPPDFSTLPRWISAKSMYDVSQRERFAKLIEVLKGPGKVARRPDPWRMPDDYVHREELSRLLKSAMLDDKGDSITTTVALTGAGGVGKTALAAALCEDEDIRDAYYDGILWVTLGEHPKLIEKIADLVERLTGERQSIAEVRPAAARLMEILRDKRCLLVIDDVWRRGDIEVFLGDTPQLTRLIATRRDDILQDAVVNVTVDAMTDGEAYVLLSHGLPVPRGEQQEALQHLATERLSDWPLLLRLVNAWLRRAVGHDG